MTRMPIIVKTERLTLLTTPEFKALLTAEAATAGVSVAELVRRRCQPEAGEAEALLAASARASCTVRLVRRGNRSEVA